MKFPGVTATSLMSCSGEPVLFVTMTSSVGRLQKQFVLRHLQGSDPAVAGCLFRPVQPGPIAIRDKIGLRKCAPARQRPQIGERSTAAFEPGRDLFCFITL